MAHLDDQTSEIEALGSIYDSDFTLLNNPTIATHASFKIHIIPSSQPVHVEIEVGITFPAEYPDVAPIVEVKSVKGLDDSGLSDLKASLTTYSNSKIGEMQCYELIEHAREWCNAHNEPGGEGSAYDEMMKRQRAKDKSTAQNDKSNSAYNIEEDPSIDAATKQRKAQSAAAEDEATRRKREGTTVTVENFIAWRDKFEKEMAAEAKKRLEEQLKAGQAVDAVPGAIIIDPVTGKPKQTGRQLFEADSTLATSDTAAIEKSTVESPMGEGTTAAGAGVQEYVVDASLYTGEDLDDLDLEDDEDEDYAPGEADEDDDDDASFPDDDSDED